MWHCFTSFWQGGGNTGRTSGNDLGILTALTIAVYIYAVPLIGMNVETEVVFLNFETVFPPHQEAVKGTTKHFMVLCQHASLEVTVPLEEHYPSASSFKNKHK